MNLKDVLAKLSKGEELSAEEKDFLQKFDPDRMADDKAAGARKKAEAELEKAQKQVADLTKQVEELTKKAKEKENAGKSDAEKYQDQIREMSENLKRLQERADGAEKEKNALARAHALADLRARHKIKFQDGLDHKMLEKAFDGVFDGVDDLSDEAAVSTKIETFKRINSAALVDTSGSGTGAKPHVSAVQVGRSGKPIAEMSEAERSKDLVSKGLI